MDIGRQSVSCVTVAYFQKTFEAINNKMHKYDKITHRHMVNREI